MSSPLEELFEKVSSDFLSGREEWVRGEKTGWKLLAKEWEEKLNSESATGTTTFWWILSELKAGVLPVAALSSSLDSEFEVDRWKEDPELALATTLLAASLLKKNNQDRLSVAIAEKAKDVAESTPRLAPFVGDITDGLIQGVKKEISAIEESGTETKEISGLKEFLGGLEANRSSDIAYEEEDFYLEPEKEVSNASLEEGVISAGKERKSGFGKNLLFLLLILGLGSGGLYFYNNRISVDTEKRLEDALGIAKNQGEDFFAKTSKDPKDLFKNAEDSSSEVREVSGKETEKQTPEPESRLSKIKDRLDKKIEGKNKNTSEQENILPVNSEQEDFDYNSSKTKKEEGMTRVYSLEDSPKKQGELNLDPGRFGNTRVVDAGSSKLSTDIVKKKKQRHALHTNRPWEDQQILGEMYVLIVPSKVMAKPSFRSEVRSELGVGDRVEVVRRSGQWLELRSKGGKPGYILAQDAELE